MDLGSQPSRRSSRGCRGLGRVGFVNGFFVMLHFHFLGRMVYALFDVCFWLTVWYDEVRDLL